MMVHVYLPIIPNGDTRKLKIKNAFRKLYVEQKKKTETEKTKGRY